MRIERVKAQGACVETVAGALSRRQRELAFVPDRPWIDGERYRLRIVSGPNATCDANEVCGANGRAASFDPLAGTTAGGPDLVADFVGAAASDATTLFASTSPRSDSNASGHMEQGENSVTSTASRCRSRDSGLIRREFTPDASPKRRKNEACM